MTGKIEIRNSTAEFLIFQIEGKEDGVQVLCKDETIWCTQEAIAILFDKAKSTISEHLKNIFASGELIQDMVVRKFRTTTQHGAIKGKTQSHDVAFYNLDAIISVGYRVNSAMEAAFCRATRATLAGSITPLLKRFSYFSVRAL